MANFTLPDKRRAATFTPVGGTSVGNRLLNPSQPLLLVGGEDFIQSNDLLGNITVTVNVSSTWKYRPEVNLWKRVWLDDDTEQQVAR